MSTLQGKVAFATRTDASSRHQGTLPAGGSTVVNASLSTRWHHCVNMLPVDGSSSYNTSSSSGPLPSTHKYLCCLSMGSLQYKV